MAPVRDRDQLVTAVCHPSHSIHDQKSAQSPRHPFVNFMVGMFGGLVLAPAVFSRLETVQFGAVSGYV